jgi:hypothetical protein
MSAAGFALFFVSGAAPIVGGLLLAYAILAIVLRNE